MAWKRSSFHEVGLLVWQAQAGPDWHSCELGEDLILDVAESELNATDIESMLGLLEGNRKRGSSLVFRINENQLPLFGDDEWPIAPSLQEAYDVLEMERIERALQNP